VWWFLPIVAAIRVAFTEGDSATQPIGFSWQWFEAVLDDEGFRASFAHSVWLALLTAAIATPLGTATAIGMRRWRSPWSRTALAVVVVAVVVPQSVLATALFLALVGITPVRLGASTQLLGHVTLALPFVVLVVWISLESLGEDLDESAVDLGATQASALLRVTVPLIAPAIIAGAAIAWVLSFDNLVLSSWLCLRTDCVTIPMRIYGRGDPRAAPILFAYVTIALAFTSVLALVMVPWIRRVVRGATPS